MPSSKSPERRGIMRAYGAEIELVDGDISDAKDRADEIEREEGAVQLGQFENPANPEAHYRTTAEEILEQIGSREPDALVAGVGTGGTLSGNARRLREEFPDMEVVAVEPEGNTPIKTGEGGSDDFQGMGPGFVSENTDTDLIDDVEVVSLADAEEECRRLAREEGILVGQSSGASNLAAKRVAERLADDGTDGDCPRPDNTTDVLGESDGVLVADGEAGSDCPFVLTVFWDSGERYVSTGMFD
jgi:cysteine synthase A